MKNLLFIILFLICSISSVAQNKIDNLVEKYSDNSISIYTSEGELSLSPVIKYNSDGKPYSIRLDGDRTENPDKISEFFLSLFNNKLKEGFTTNTPILLLRPPFSKENIRSSMDYYSLELESKGFKIEFKKDNYLFKAKVYEIGSLDIYDRTKYYFFHIEMIDKSRLGGSKSSKFKF